MSRLLIVSGFAVSAAMLCVGCGAGSSEPDEATLHKTMAGPPSSANIRAHKLHGVGQAKAQQNGAAGAGTPAGAPTAGTPGGQ